MNSSKIGTPFGMSEWFNGEPVIEETRLVPYRARWRCPECSTGEMKFNGFVWSTSPEGNHHACDRCGFTAALRGERYPCIKHHEEPKSFPHSTSENPHETVPEPGETGEKVGK